MKKDTQRIGRVEWACKDNELRIDQGKNVQCINDLRYNGKTT